MSELVRILDIEAIDLDMFRGHTPPGETRRIYGGQVVAQSLAAAYRTVDSRVCHSMHAYFIRGGDPNIPILLKVERVRDGGSFTMRRVTALQHGQQIFNLSASFQAVEQGLEHQIEMPTPPGPEGLLDEDELRKAGGETEQRRTWPIEVRPVDPLPYGKAPIMDPVQSVWFRARDPLGSDPMIHQCALAYATDMTLLDTSLRPHGIPWSEGRLQVASLDHALWFHHASDFTEWHLYVQDSPSASGGRGFNRGSIFNSDGKLVASATQEALIRYR
ncbi:acyl-CoA thioesterase II [Phenylobacterium sp. Root77]|uniref:acyl-CoA thioesterase n=1 Tax=unclassified Phenylobacterium TaxID=2640670 RepID=UPI0006FEC378|nr:MULTISPECIES: acyl-CoA thioesterase II [unclassified Phenylobacterium]KQW69325.1 acyl-CoA thioesterase II [Phenylobacterium sp. Root1277]KQW95309.1 acyl-CoA thioesterase II [Phenylobacterium sp. Root1290]KRC41100.1 acyl-CoA thioesterase II [Phenylobacterium sp. Root77]